jgi:superfamily II DNA or RNA helicase
MEISFDRGTLVVVDGLSQAFMDKSLFAFDERTQTWRSPAERYRDIVLALTQEDIPYKDLARKYERLNLAFTKPIKPRPHQIEAIKAWSDGGKRGVVQMPTGSGKTFLALMAILHIQRPTLVVVPTIDLLHQWQNVLTEYFGIEVGGLGGGERNIQPITVTTFDSAVIHLNSVGNQFGFLIIDECHHLPAPQYINIAYGTIAPFRLGLSATVERADGKESEIFSLIGPLVYESRIDNMSEDVLSPYDVVSIEVSLTPEETKTYTERRAVYTSFVRQHRVDFSRPDGWKQFLIIAARMPGGREAMKAYRAQKKLAQASSGKIGEVWKILQRHRGERVIIFTDDNEMAYRLGREFLLPVLTHQTKGAERKKMLTAFRSGELDIMVTSKVLNEGVDVPEASIGIVVSGSGTVREHVQRLGRILRHKPGKKAVMYELVSKGTSELNVNKRRKNHYAYKRTY